MKMKVLVYDNELGYYQMLKDNIVTGFDFVLYRNGQTSKGFDVVVFFLNNQIEAIDMLKLYNEDIPFVLGIINGHNNIQHRDNAYIINIAQTYDEIEASMRNLFNELELIYENEKALN